MTEYEQDSPSKKGLLEILLFELERIYDKQLFLETLYKAILSLGYYGLMRIGELVSGSHPVKAKDIHIALNKNKILIYLHSSKTHGKESLPQEIKIKATSEDGHKRNCFFCPFTLLRNYLKLRGEYFELEEPFFVHSNKTPVTPSQLRAVLKQLLENVNLDPSLYGVHSLRIGRCSDMLLKYNYSLQEVKRAGRWRSTAVFRYLKS